MKTQTVVAGLVGLGLGLVTRELAARHQFEQLKRQGEYAYCGHCFRPIAPHAASDVREQISAHMVWHAKSA